MNSLKTRCFKHTKEQTSFTSEQTTILESDVDIEFGNEVLPVKKVYSILSSCTENDTFRSCQSVKDGNSLKAMGLLMKIYEPKTAGTKTVLPKVALNNSLANKHEEIEKNLLNVEELMNECKVLGGEPLLEDLRVTGLVDLRTQDLKEHFALITLEMKYQRSRMRS